MVKEHGLTLYSSRAVRDALNQYCAKYHVDKTYAAQQCMLKSLHSEGFLDNDTFATEFATFNKPLVVPNAPKKIVYASLEEKLKIEEETKFLKRLINSQWTYYKDDPIKRRRFVEEAKQWQDKIPEAKQLLEMAKKDGYE